jgi:hypothetical protein
MRRPVPHQPPGRSAAAPAGARYFPRPLQETSHEPSPSYLLSSGLAGLAPAFLTRPRDAAGVSSAEIVLGTHLDLSGPAAITMPPIRNGLQMRVDEANEAAASMAASCAS